MEQLYQHDMVSLQKVCENCQFLLFVMSFLPFSLSHLTLPSSLSLSGLTLASPHSLCILTFTSFLFAFLLFLPPFLSVFLLFLPLFHSLFILFLPLFYTLAASKNANLGSGHTEDEEVILQSCRTCLQTFSGLPIPPFTTSHSPCSCIWYQAELLLLKLKCLLHVCL